MNRSMNKRRRRGMTILEVLFAIMITTIGLLGAIAVFPVASEYARKGRLNDELAVCAESAVHKFDAQYMRRPDRWVRYFYNSNNSSYSLVPGAAAGESYCIDPRFYAQNLIPNPNMPPNNFPNPIPGDPQATVFPSYPQPNLTGVPANVGPPRMARLTLWNNNPFSPLPMGRFQADLTFSFEDQLTYERPGVQKGLTGNDNASPAFQIYTPIKDTPNNAIYPGKREDEGKLSWMTTLVPKIDQQTGAFDDKYVVSTVIFYSRNPNLVYPPSGELNEKSAIILGQSLANANVSDFHANGYGGGEVTISTPLANGIDFLKVRAGDWVMLAGYIRGPADVGSSSTDTLGNKPPFTVRKAFKWYRITDADEDPYQNGNLYQRDVTLVGPDWDLANVLPVQIDSTTGNIDSYPDTFYDDVEVIIVPHVVAVFDRTVRLELDGTGF